MNSYPQTRQVVCYLDVTIAAIASIARVATYAILISVAIGVCGCANTEIGVARAELTKGNYAAAHERFVALLKQKRWPCFYQELAGGHNWTSWRAHLKDLLTFLWPGEPGKPTDRKTRRRRKKR